MIYFLFIVFALTTFSEDNLSRIIHTLIILQIMIQLMGTASEDLTANRSTFGAVMGWFSLINWNVAYIQPACNMGSLTFIAMYWGTTLLFLLLIIFVLLFLAFFSSFSRQIGQTRFDTFNSRLPYTFLSLFTVTYFEMALRFFSKYKL